MNLKEEILGVMIQDMELGFNKSATITFKMLEKVLMVMGEVDICLRPAIISSIIKVILVDHWVFMVMVMAEVNIGLIPKNFSYNHGVLYILHPRFIFMWYRKKSYGRLTGYIT